MANLLTQTDIFGVILTGKQQHRLALHLLVRAQGLTTCLHTKQAILHAMQYFSGVAGKGQLSLARTALQNSAHVACKNCQVNYYTLHAVASLLTGDFAQTLLCLQLAYDHQAGLGAKTYPLLAKTLRFVASMVSVRKVVTLPFTA